MDAGFSSGQDADRVRELVRGRVSALLARPLGSFAIRGDVARKDLRTRGRTKETLAATLLYLLVLRVPATDVEAR